MNTQYVLFSFEGLTVKLGLLGEWRVRIILVGSSVGVCVGRVIDNHFLLFYILHITLCVS